MRILNYGSLNIDFVYQVDHIVKPGETISSQSLKKFAGGKGANQSVAMAKAGAEVWHAGKIGHDGQWLLDILVNNGIHTELVTSYDGPTGHAVIQVNQEGENSIVLFGGGNKMIDVVEVENNLKNFKPGEYIVLQNEINDVSGIIELAASYSLKICLNPAPFSRDVLSWPLDKIDILILNTSEGEGLAGIEGDIEEILSVLSKRYENCEIVLTDGKNGAYYCRGSFRIFVPSIEVKVVDTTAAGDTFLGYFLVSRASGATPLEAMQQATAAAAITVSRPGAIESIPEAAELALR
jgi:ribokinase